MKAANSNLISLICGAICASVFCVGLAQPAAGQGARYIVKLRETADLSAALGIATALPIPGAQIKTGGLSVVRPALAQQPAARRAVARGGSTRPNPLERILIVSSPDPQAGPDEIRAALGSAEIEYIEVDAALQLFATPTDPLFARQWHLQNDGQEYVGVERFPGDGNDTLKVVQGTPGEDIGVRGDYTDPYPRRNRPLVAIIDTGVDGDHPDLAPALWSNPGETPGNGVDDDHNGLVDDTWGYDFSGDQPRIININDDNDPSDNVGHGSHVAGIVAAAADGAGVVGVCPDAELMALKIFPNAFASVGAEAVVYAVNNGADVINASWGAAFPSQLLEDAFLYAVDNGVFVAVASGNTSGNERFQPANIESVYTVGAANSDGFVTYFSTYGAHIDIVAPGQDILSVRADSTDLYAGEEPGLRIVDSLWYLSDGTSMASPMVAGAAALLKAVRPELDGAGIAQALSAGARDIVQPFDTGADYPGFDSLSGAGFLDIGRALQLLSGPALTFAAPTNYSRQTGDVELVALPIEGYSGSWSLEFGVGWAPESFSPLASAGSVPVDSILFTYTGAYPGGLITFRLTAGGAESLLRVRVTRPSIAELTAPSDGDTVRYVAPVRGYAHADTYQSYTLTLRRSNGSQRLLSNGSSEFYGELIHTLEFGSEESGDYWVVLQVFTGSETLRDSVSIVVESTLHPGWPVIAPGFTSISPVSVDLDGDGAKELIVGTRSGVSAYHLDGTVAPGFPVADGFDCRSVPLVEDFDGDSLPEIIFTSDSGLHVVDRTGQSLPNFPQRTPTGQVFLGFPTPQILQLAPEEERAILFVNAYGQLRAYHFNGDSYFYSLSGLFTRIDPNITNDYRYKGLSMPHLAAVDMNSDGRNELIAGYSSPGATSGLFAFSGRDGQPALWRESARSLSIHLSHGLAFGDVDGDGAVDVLTSGELSDGSIAVWLRRNGDEDLPGWPILLPELKDWIGHYPVLADVDGDAEPEAILVYSEFDISKVFVFNTDGTPFVNRDGVSYGEVFAIRESLASPSVADIDGDGRNELILRSGFVFPGTGFERIRAITGAGVELPDFPIITTADPSEVTSAGVVPLLDDLDNDGRWELALLGSGQRIHVWDLTGPAAQRAWDWPRFLHDNRNSGVGGAQ